MSGAVTPLHLTHEEAIAVLNWHLAYERAMREVVEAALVYEHEMHIMHDDALRVAQGLIESEGQALAAAREEIDRMKVCGNCRHCEAHGLFCVEATLLGYDGARDEGWPNWYKDGSFNVHVLLGDPCHFTPSRWTPTTEAPE
jgi:hypothetical protein